MCAGVLAFLPAAVAAADDTPSPSPLTDYFDLWFDRVDAIQAMQPHWMTPIATNVTAGRLRCRP